MSVEGRQCARCLRPMALDAPPGPPWTCDACRIGSEQSDSPNVYRRFCEEVDALVIGADDSAVSVVGELTRAVKRAQMVVDGELPPVAVRSKRAADQYVSEVMDGLAAAREPKSKEADDR